MGSSPGRRSRSLSKTRSVKGAVTPSFHMGVPDSLSVAPCRGEGIWQQLGWRKVCGTEKSGFWVPKGGTGSYTLPFNLDHLIKCGLDENGHALHRLGHTRERVRDPVWNEVTD